MYLGMLEIEVIADYLRNNKRDVGKDVPITANSSHEK